MQVPPRAHASVRSLPRGPGFGPCNSRQREAPASAFTAPLPVDLPDGNAGNVEPGSTACTACAACRAGQEKAKEEGQRAQRLESLSAEAHKEACGATILLGKLLAVLAVLLFLWWTFQLWQLQQHDAAQALKTSLQVRDLQGELAAAGKQASRLREQRDELRSLQMALRHEKADAEKRAYQATSQLGDRDGQISDLQEELQSTDDIAEKLQHELADGAVAWRHSLETSQRTLLEVQGKVKRGQSHLVTQQGQIEKLQGEISQLHDHLKAAEGRYNQSRMSLEVMGQDAATQREEMEAQQEELQQQLKAAHGKEAELRRQLKAVQLEHGVQLREAAQHEAKAISKVQEQVKNSEDFVQKLLRQLALAAQQREEGEEKLATLQSKLQTKERWAQDVAQSLEQLMDSGDAHAPRATMGPAAGSPKSVRHRRLKIK